MFRSLVSAVFFQHKYSRRSIEDIPQNLYWWNSDALSGDMAGDYAEFLDVNRGQQG